MSQTTAFDVLIIGSGGAGLSLALRLPALLRVAVLSKGPITESSTLYAQGGVSAVLDKDDSIESHVEEQLDDRTQRAQLAVQQAAVVAAKAQLARQAASPRVEDLPIIEAQLAEARVALIDAKRQQTLVEGVSDKRAVSVDEVERRRAATQAGEARVRQGEAELAKLKAGAWAPDLAVAQAQVAQAEAVMRATEVDIARLSVTAPVAATVLQVKIRPGEFAAAGVLAQPHVQLGATDTLHVRVDIDENDAWRFKPGAAGECFVRGNLHLHAKLRFVRVEPYVVPKRSLTGDVAERVDTRVLQVIYAFDPKELTAYVGQQVDVYIETATLPPVAAPAPRSQP